MRSSHVKIIITTAASILFAFSTLSSAALNDEQWLEFSVNGYRFILDDTRPDDMNSFGMEFGFAYSPSTRLSVGISSADDQAYKYIHSDFSYFFLPDRGINPFFGIGLGAFDGEAIEDEAFGAVQVGLRISPWKYFHIEPIMRWHFAFDQDTRDAGVGLRLTAALNHRRGNRNAFDSDADGVPDYKDECPDTPLGAVVDEFGCHDKKPALDSDGDGVPDERDYCPDTPPNTPVDELGCPKDDRVVQRRAFSDINFEFDSARLTSDAKEILTEQANGLRGKQYTRVTVDGHTDSIGSEEYNQGLSERRANAIANALADAGVALDLIEARGYGELQPMTTNATDEGRARNRRGLITVWNDLVNDAGEQHVEPYQAPAKQQEVAPLYVDQYQPVETSQVTIFENGETEYEEDEYSPDYDDQPNWVGEDGDFTEPTVSEPENYQTSSDSHEVEQTYNTGEPANENDTAEVFESGVAADDEYAADYDGQANWVGEDGEYVIEDNDSDYNTQVDYLAEAPNSHSHTTQNYSSGIDGFQTVVYEKTLGSALFVSNSKDLSSSMRRALRSVYADLSQLGNERIVVIGHTDNDGSSSYNDWLSQRRADAVRDYLIELGIESHRIVAVGYGEHQPVAGNDTATGKAQNRRIEVIAGE